MKEKDIQRKHKREKKEKNTEVNKDKQKYLTDKKMLP